MSQKITSLRVLTVVRNATKGKGKVTDITISIPGTGLVVARATKGGVWNETQALAEFKRLPNTFKHEQGYETAKAMRLAA